MTWRGSTTSLDRTFACLPYLLPLLDGVADFSAPFFQQFPALLPLNDALAPLLFLYRGIPFMSLIIFLGLYMLVVRADNVSHFIRFNTMQALMLGIVLFLCAIILQYVLTPILSGISGGALVFNTLCNVVFLGTIAAVVYSVIQSLLGQYAEIPTLSDAVHMQVR